jgi:alkylation response protein AidB-like acyl-CoA dehydrogenase
VTPAVAAPEVEELRTVVREFLAQHSPAQRALELMESPDGADPAVWRQMADQLALQALAVPEEHGGQGFGFAELAVALEELGRVNYYGPFFATTVLTTHALLLSGDDEACAAHLPRIAGGELTATVAMFETDWALDAAATVATPDDGAWRLDGAKQRVLDGADAGMLLVTARCEDGIGLFAVDGDADGLRRSPSSVLDLTRPLASIDLVGVAATRVGSGDATAKLLPALRDHALAALACEQAGGTQACVEMTVAYATDRFQFGRAIGSYQAVRHRCADMFIAAETSRATARHAARAVADGDPDGPVAAAIAKSYCSEQFLRAAADTIQLHGGTGFTWEHPAHVFFKRAKASSLLFGDPAAHRARMAPALLRPAEATR